MTNGRAQDRDASVALSPAFDLISAIRPSKSQMKAATIVAAAINRVDGAAQHHSRGGDGHPNRVGCAP
jgi:hypothetical protein